MEQMNRRKRSVSHPFRSVEGGGASPPVPGKGPGGSNDILSARGAASLGGIGYGSGRVLDLVARPNAPDDVPPPVLTVMVTSVVVDPPCGLPLGGCVAPGELSSEYSGTMTGCCCAYCSA